MADQMVVRLVETPAENVFTSYYDDPAALDSIFSETTFVVSHGEIAPLP